MKEHYMFARKPLLAASLVLVALLEAACSSTSPGGGGATKTDASTNSGLGGAAAAAAAKGLNIDLSKCATDPTVKFGSTVKVGETYPMSGGPATAFAPIGEGVKAAFANFDATSGLSTKFNLVQTDDQFAPDKALAATQQLIQHSKVAVMTSTIGTPSVLAIRPLLEAECIPLIGGVASGASANQPATDPWTIPFTLPSAVDARIWVQNIADKFPNGAKIALFHANDATGNGYLAAVKHYLSGTKSTIVSTQSIEDTDSAAPASQVTTMRSSGATVLMAAPTGSQCVSLMKEVAGQGWKPTFYLSSTCATSLFDLAGASANGVYVTQWVKDPTRAPYNTDPAVVAAAAALKKYSPSTPVNNSSIGGMIYASTLFQAIKIASASPLGLSRLGLLQAATHMSFQPDLVIPGIKYSLDYPKDEVALEAGELTQYEASNKTFTNIKLYNFQGQMTGVASS
jgi:branched-chain amino acid transport system substrate-binding protein